VSAKRAPSTSPLFFSESDQNSINAAQFKASPTRVFGKRRNGRCRPLDRGRSDKRTVDQSRSDPVRMSFRRYCISRKHVSSRSLWATEFVGWL